MQLVRNIQSVMKRIGDAAERSNRDAAEITLIAVSKTVTEAMIREAYACGLRIFGENRPQQLEGKASMLADLKDIQWHMIGHLQRNKVKSVLPVAALIHSVDSLRLAEELNRHSIERGCETPILLEVNISGEQSKFGFAEQEALDACRFIATMQGIVVKGLMTMAPFAADPDETRPVFTRVRQLADFIRDQAITRIEMSVLSMGMSNDFEIAIEEGATMVRIGTALWEGLSE